jgi:hypothetical protein
MRSNESLVGMASTPAVRRQPIARDDYHGLVTVEDRFQVRPPLLARDEGIRSSRVIRSRSYRRRLQLSAVLAQQHEPSDGREEPAEEEPPPGVCAQKAQKIPKRKKTRLIGAYFSKFMAHPPHLDKQDEIVTGSWVVWLIHRSCEERPIRFSRPHITTREAPARTGCAA